MSTYEHDALMQYPDQNGDMHITYPITRAENVVDLYGDAELTGVPTAPTAAAGTNTNQVATTEFVQSEIADLKKYLVELHGAIINVTTEETTLIGKDVILKKDEVLINIKQFDNNGTCSFVVQETGDYTLSASDGTYSANKLVTITSDDVVYRIVSSVNLSLIPVGETYTPTDEVNTWLKCAGIKDKNYTTVREVLDDTDTIFKLTCDENAMKYLERSTSFSDELCTDETFMSYLGQSAYVGNTILNSDLWKQKIKESQYWSLVYASNIVTIHGAASETITIDGYGGSFITGTDGSCSHVVPIGEITLIGSVSGQSFTRTVTSDTTEVYAMPTGALYWYGHVSKTFEPITPLPSNYVETCYKEYINHFTIESVKAVHNMVASSGKKIDIAKYSKFIGIISYTNNPSDLGCAIYVADSQYVNSLSNTLKFITNNTNIETAVTIDLKDLNSSYYLGTYASGDTCTKVLALWLE